MPDWLDDLTRKAKEKYGTGMQQEHRTAEQKRIMSEAEQKFWKELNAALQRDAGKFNDGMGAVVMFISAPNSNLVRVTAKFTKQHTPTTELSLHPDRHVVEWPDQRLTYLFAGDKLSLPELRGQPITPDELSKQVISLLVG